jgi:F-box protein 21
MYIDPYTSAQEIRLEELERRQAVFRANFGGQTPPIESFLDPAPVRQLVLRMAGNLEATYRLNKRLPQDDVRAAELMRLRAGDPEQNLEACLYAHLWAVLMAAPPTTAGWDGGLDFFLNRFALQYSEDHWIVEKYLGPRYDAFVAAGEGEDGHRQNRVGWENVREILKMLSNLDMRQPMLNRRYTQDIDERVRFKIGQVVRHARYGYVGVVTGWAAAGMAALPTPHYVPPGDGQGEEEEGEWHGTSFRMKGRTYYTVL